MSKALGRSVIRRVFLLTIWLFFNLWNSTAFRFGVREVMKSRVNSLWITSLSSARMGSRQIPQGKCGQSPELSRWVQNVVTRLNHKVVPTHKRNSEQPKFDWDATVTQDPFQIQPRCICSIPSLHSYRTGWVPMVMKEVWVRNGGIRINS